MVAQAFVETVLTSIGVSAFAMSVNMSIQKPVHMAAHMSVHMPTHTWSWRSVRIRAGDIFVHCSSSVSSTVMNCASVTVAIPWDARMRLAKFVEPCVRACVHSSVQGPVSFCGCVRPVRPPKKLCHHVLDTNRNRMLLVAWLLRNAAIHGRRWFYAFRAEPMVLKPD